MKNFFSKAITVVALCVGFSSIQAQDAKDAKESKFTVVTAKRRSGLQESALFFHLLNDS